MTFRPALLLAALSIAAAPAPHNDLPDLPIGTPLPAAEVAMTDVSGKDMTLGQLAKENGLLVIFSCNTCPFVVGSEDSEGWEGRYPALGLMCRKSGIGMALVNSNEAKRDKGDGLADMQRHYLSKGYNNYYLLDKQHVVADAFGARTTPHVFLFNKEGRLVYKGAIDDNVKSAAEVKEKHLENAITAMLAGHEADPSMTRNLGCSIKRVEHTH